MPYRTVQLGDGHDLEYHVSGPAKAASLLVFHVGSPSAAVGYPGLTAAAAAQGMRTVCYSRQGYAGSTRNPGRRVGDEAAITALLADRAPAEVIHSCGSGVTACHNLLAMEHAGLSGSRLYPGSWSEWSADPTRPRATTED